MYFCHLNASLLNKSIHFFLFFFFLSYWAQLLNSGVLLSSDIKEQIRHCRLTYFFGQCKTLWVSDGCKFFLFQLLDGLLLVSQIELGANQNNWSGRAVVPHLWIPLEGAEEQIRTINSLLIISPSLMLYGISLCLSVVKYMDYEAIHLQRVEIFSTFWCFHCLLHLLPTPQSLCKSFSSNSKWSENTG